MDFWALIRQLVYWLASVYVVDGVKHCDSLECLRQDGVVIDGHGNRSAHANGWVGIHDGCAWV